MFHKDSSAPYDSINFALYGQISGGGENRTLVRKPSPKESTYVAAYLKFRPIGCGNGQDPMGLARVVLTNRVLRAGDPAGQPAKLRLTSGSQATPEETWQTKPPVLVRYSRLCFPGFLTRSVDRGMHPSTQNTPVETCHPPTVECIIGFRGCQENGRPSGCLLGSAALGTELIV